MRNVIIVYGGVFPTYHFRDVMQAEPQLDVIVRGDGEATALRLLDALENDEDLKAVDGITFRRADGIVVENNPAEMIRDLDAFRVGWELIDPSRYGYYGGKRAVVMQFSRGCPHHCNYCGQRGFWARWRHRDPQKFAAEIAWLHRVHGVELINLADENPTVNKAAWRAFCEAMIAENVPVSIIGSTRTGDIVRDADILHLYRQAGIERFLLGIENTDEATLAIGAEAVGCMEVLYKATVEYCKTRVQFGQPIGKFQVLQHRMVDMFMEYEQSKSLMFMAAMRLAEGYGPEAQKAVSAFKVQVGKSGRFVGQQAVQLHGGMGMTEELSIGHYFKRLTMIDTMFGNVDHHLKRFGSL